MTLSTTNYTLPWTYLGNQTVGSYVPVPPANHSADPDAPVDPSINNVTTTAMSNGEIVLISGGSLLGVMFLTLAWMCYMSY